MNKVLKISAGLVAVFAALVSGADKTLLALGSVAPDFTLNTEKGESVKLSSFAGKNAVVLVFYPGDETPVCTEQLCAIRDSWSGFTAKGAVVFGVNPASAVSHEKFIVKQHYPFPLLVDDAKTVTVAYGCKGALMTSRTVYVVGKDGTIIYAQRGKPPVADILAAIPQ